jgi:hypothetical protein
MIPRDHVYIIESTPIITKSYVGPGRATSCHRLHNPPFVCRKNALTRGKKSPRT